MKLTPWFSEKIKPARVGWYQRRWPNLDIPNPSVWFNYWDGKHWYFSLNGDMKDRATKYHGTNADCCLGMQWRGLAVDPRKAEERRG